MACIQAKICHFTLGYVAALRATKRHLKERTLRRLKAAQTGCIMRAKSGYRKLYEGSLISAQRVQELHADTKGHDPGNIRIWQQVFGSRRR